MAVHDAGTRGCISPRRSGEVLREVRPSLRDAPELGHHSVAHHGVRGELRRPWRDSRIQALVARPVFCENVKSCEFVNPMGSRIRQFVKASGPGVDLGQAKLVKIRNGWWPEGYERTWVHEFTEFHVFTNPNLATRA